MIFGFRVVAATIALVALIEGVCALALRPGLVERSDLGLLDRFHNSVIFGKLADFESSAPDIIQVGDSSGFHGVRPEIVMGYLGGLKYVNLSCCAGTGYRGYYAIADFMLRRNPSIKTVVLYLGWSNLPRTDLIHGERRVGDAMQESLTSPFANLFPPTIALRQKIVEAVDAKRQPRLESAFIADMRQSTHGHFGWWAEHDRRLAGDKRVAYWRQACGETGVPVRDDQAMFYGDETGHGKQSLMVTELERFASLAAWHGARLVVLFHPFSCRGLEGSLLPARRADIRAVMSRHSNMIALPEQILELWPTEKFVSADHLHTGFDEENSRRVGALLARALGLPSGGPTTAPNKAGSAADAPGPTKPARPQWRAEGADLSPADAQGETDGFRRLIERSGPGGHFVEATLTGVDPGAITVLSFPLRAFGARGIAVELRTDRQYAGGYCDLPGGTAQRDGEMLDVGLDVRSDGSARCWVSMALKTSTATVRLSLLDHWLQPAYAGDGRSGVAIGDLELRQAAHFVHAESSPW
jgi:hypothetical protein